MVNALIDDANRGITVATGIEVTGVRTTTPTKNLQVVDVSDNSVIMSVSRANGCDINADTMMHTPLSTNIPLFIMD